MVCDIDFLIPAGLTFKQTNQYDPNPRERIKLREWHLTATTTEKKKRMEFVTLYRPYRVGENVPDEARLKRVKGGYTLLVKLSDGEFAALLPTDDQAELTGFGLSSKGTIKARLKRVGSTEIIGL